MNRLIAPIQSRRKVERSMVRVFRERPLFAPRKSTLEGDKNRVCSPWIPSQPPIRMIEIRSRKKISQPQIDMVPLNRQPLSMYGWVENSISPTDEKTQEISLWQHGETTERKHRLLKEGIGQPMLLVFYHEGEGKKKKAELTITGGELLPCHDNKRIAGGINSPPLKK